jgi:hypothetical protein
MQTLGLATSDARSEGRLKSLLWPTVKSDMDVDYLTTQGFRTCFIVAIGTLVFSAVSAPGSESQIRSFSISVETVCGGEVLPRRSASSLCMPSLRCGRFQSRELC